MPMDQTKKLLQTMRNAAVNMEKVADAIEEREGITEQSAISRRKSRMFTQFAMDLEQALTEDGVALD